MNSNSMGMNNVNYNNSGFNTSTNSVPIIQQGSNFNQMGLSTNFNPYLQASTIPLSSTIITTNSNFIPSVGISMGTQQVRFIGVVGCFKCNGSGWKFSKKKNKLKACKKCMQAKGLCAHCGNTGFKYKNGKVCKCKNKLSHLFNKFF